MNNRINVIALYVVKGMISLIDTDGEVRVYRQRGIQRLSEVEIAKEIKEGRLNKDWKQYKEVPNNYSVSFECPDIQGRCLVTYRLILDKQKKIKSKNNNEKHTNSKKQKSNKK